MTSDMGYYVYILTCSDGTLYTGITKDLMRRLSEHNKKTGARYTQTRTPVVLSYHEFHESRSEALKREVKIKRMKRKQKLELIEKEKNDIIR